MIDGKFKTVQKLTTSVLALAALIPASATAQSMNYGQLQQLFQEPVTTSATGNPQRASDVPVKMDIITQEEIQRSGARDIPGVLQDVNGVNLLRWDNQAADVGIRGYNKPFSSRLLVLVNGRQVYLDHFGFTAWSTIPVSMQEIRQIEVVKGPNTALFGFNAVGGVVNIVTYNPLYDDKDNVTVRGGTEELRQGSIVNTFQFGKGKDSSGLKGGIRVSAQGLKAEEFDTDQSGDQNGDPIFGNVTRLDPEKRSVNIDGLFQVTDNSQLRVEASRSASEQFQFLPIFRPSSLQFETHSAKAKYMHESDLGLITAQVYTNILDKDFVGGVFDGAHIDNQVTVAQLNDKLKIGNDHNVRFGVEYRHNVMESAIMAGDSETANPDDTSGDELFYDLYSVNGMWNWQINDELNLTTAARFDHLNLERNGPLDANNPLTNSDFDQKLNEVSANVGLVWKPTSKDTARFSFARGIQAPSLIDFGMNARSSNGGPMRNSLTILGNPRMEAPVTTNYEIGYDRKVKDINGKLRTSVFYQETWDVKSLLAEHVSGVPRTLRNANIGDSKTFGIELGAEGQFNPHFSWDAGYIFQRVSDDLNNNSAGDIQNDSTPAEFEEATPAHQFNLGLGYTRDKWTIDTQANYVSQRELLNFTGFGGGGPQLTQDTVNNHVALKARVGYDITDNITFSVSGQNLAYGDRELTSGPEVERSAFAELSVNF